MHAGDVFRPRAGHLNRVIASDYIMSSLSTLLYCIGAEPIQQIHLGSFDMDHYKELENQLLMSISTCRFVPFWNPHTGEIYKNIFRD